MKDMKNIKDMKREKSYSLLMIGAALLITGIIAAFYFYHASYTPSKDTANRLTEIKEQIQQAREGHTAEDPQALAARESELSAAKLAQERPYSYALTAVFLSLLLTARGLHNALIGKAPSEFSTRRLALAGLMAALCYIGFAFFKIDIPVGTEKTAFHFGNVFCVLAALLIGGFWGGLAGAVGMTIGDLTTSYVMSAPKTFLLKLCIGLITGFVAHKIFRLSHSHSSKYITCVTFLSSACGMVFNLIADPLAGYFYKTYLLGVPQELSGALAKISALTTGVNSVIALVLSSVFYLALRPALKKSQLFITVR